MTNMVKFYHFAALCYDGYYRAACGKSGWAYSGGETDTVYHASVDCQDCRATRAFKNSKADPTLNTRWL